MSETLRINLARGYVERYGSWAAKVSSAIVDQVFFSGSGFLINVLLARWMLPNEYGAYVVAFSWFLLAQNLYDAAIVEPMAVYGPGRFSPSLRKYLTYLLYAHVIASVLITVGLGLVALSQQHMTSGPVYSALLGAALSAPFLLMRWLTRQPFYVISRPHLAIASGVIYTLLSVGGLSWFHTLTSSAPAGTTFCSPQMGMSGCEILPAPLVLNAFWAQIILAFAAIIPSLYNIRLLSQRLPREEVATSQALPVRAVVAEHFAYGKWSVSTRFLVWAADQLYYLVLPLLAGLAGTASLRALNNLVLPVYLSMGAISSILMPTFVRVYAAQGKRGLDNKVRSIMFLVAGVSAVYFLGIVLFGYPVMHLLYDGKYDSVATPVVLFFIGLAPLISALGMAYSTALRAMEKIRQAVQSNIVTAVFTLTIGLMCTVWLGIEGAVISVFLSHVLGVAIVMRAFYLRKLNVASAEKVSTEAVI